MIKLEVYPENIESLRYALIQFYKQLKLDPMIINTPYGYDVRVNISDLASDEYELVIYSILAYNEELLQSPSKITIISGDRQETFQIEVV